VFYRHSTAIPYRLSANIVIFSKGILNDVDKPSERVMSSITPQVLVQYKRDAVFMAASICWSESLGEANVLICKH
tara:strand:+ start:289 stop:513 length:225 start_codon:yes stop_codon:yes gene_type:complete